jgi:hypothetical protein
VRLVLAHASLSRFAVDPDAPRGECARIVAVGVCAQADTCQDRPGRKRSDLCARDRCLGRCRARVQLRGHCRPGRVVVGIREFNAVQAGRDPWLYERPDPHTAVAEHDRKVGDVPAQPNAVAFGGDGVVRDDDGKVCRVRPGTIVHDTAARLQHDRQVVGGSSASVDHDARRRIVRYRLARE